MVTYHDCRIRGDNLGALVTILDNPPYGRNVDEARVTIDKLGIPKLSDSSLESNAANSRHSP